MLMLAGLIVSGCSLRITYNYLDWILPWYVDDYVNLNDNQEDFFDRATIELLDWHRYAELPRYTDFITSIKDAQNSPMSREDVEAFIDEISWLWKSLLKKAAPHLAQLARQLTDEQVEQINRALQDKNEELQKKYGSRSVKEQRQQRKEKTAELLDDWLGAVNDAQLQLIDQWSNDRQETTTAWLAYRDSWRVHFIALLMGRYEENFPQKMEEFLINPRKLYSPDYAQAAAENRVQFSQFVADISLVLSSDQRDHLQQKLADLAADLNELSEQEG